MAFMAKLALVPLLFAPLFARAALPDGRLHANLKPRPAIPKVTVASDQPVVSRNGTTLPPYDTTYYFDQLIDHENPSLGTFQQRYWHTWEFYEPGGPIILTTPGETDADGYEGYLTNATINGQIAQQQSGATIVLEHRFYGYSNPYPDLSVQSLRVHTLHQAVQDLAYFANNVTLPMPGGNNVQPDKAPWVLIGGSYAGALTAWTMTNTTDVFYAGYSSSGVVEALVDYWAYFEPIRQYMPQNCSADVEAVVAHFDQVFTSGNETAITALKNQFGLNVSHLDDAAGALRNNLWDWQSLQPTSGPNAQFFQFCDALEVNNGTNAPATGWGLDHALEAWGSYFKDTYYAILCGTEDAEDCLGTYNTNSSYWTNTTINNANRSWMWIVCNEVGYLQESPPVGKPAVVSRLIQPIYDERQCQQMFPAAFSSPPVPNVNATNAVYHGWDVQVNQLFFANGQRDPWRDVTVSADNQTIPSTATQPITEGDGYHCSDLSTANAVVDQTILAVQKQGLAYMKTWLATWNTSSTTTVPIVNINLPLSVSVSSAVAPLLISPDSKPVNAWFRGVGGA